MSIPRLDTKAVRNRLRALLEEHPGGGVVFDADGTLWSSDVGCVVFDHACQNDLLREDALESLRAEAVLREISTGKNTSVNEIARSMSEAFHAGEYEERACAEMQVWAYVGYSESEFRALTQEALLTTEHQETLHDDVLEIAEWAAQYGAQVSIVSASPRWVVEEAIQDLSFFQRETISAGDPNTEIRNSDLHILPGMASPLPYGPDKVHGGRSLLGELPWLAAFGDSNFDLEMMREAHLAVGIGEKATMLQGLREIPASIRLIF